MALPLQIAEDWPTFRVPGADPWARDLAVRLEGMRKEQAAAINEIIENLGGVATGGLEVGGVPGVGQVPKWAVGGAVWADDEVGAPGSGEANVQVDLRVTDQGSDAFVLGKETLFSGVWGDLTGVPPAAADNYVDAVNTVVAGSDVTLTLGRTGALTDLATTFAVPASGGVVPPGYGVPTWAEPHLSNIVGMPVDGYFVAYEGATGNLVFAEVVQGSGTGENDYVDAAMFGVSGQEVTLTLGRTDPLVDLTASFVVPTGAPPSAENSYVDEFNAAVSGATVTLTLGRTGYVG